MARNITRVGIVSATVYRDPAQKGETTMLNQFRSFNTDGADMDVLIAMSAFGVGLRDSYRLLTGEVPEWVSIQLKVISREVKSRLADGLEKRLREAKARRTALAPAEEKRAALDMEIAELEKQLALQP